MNSKLVTKIRTLEERDKLKEEIVLLLDSLYTQKGEGVESTLSSQVRFWVSEIIKTESSNNLGEIESYLKDILSQLSQFKTLSLRLAFEPTNASIDKFITFTRKNIGMEVILDFDYDPRILGGAVITYEGEYRDFSLKRLFETEYAEKSTEVLKIMYSK